MFAMSVIVRLQPIEAFSGSRYIVKTVMWGFWRALVIEGGPITLIINALNQLIIR